MTRDKDTIELVFDGKGVSPETFDARTSLALAYAYVDAIVALGQLLYPLPKIKGKDGKEKRNPAPPIQITLHSVRYGSNSLELGALLANPDVREAIASGEVPTLEPVDSEHEPAMASAQMLNHLAQMVGTYMAVPVQAPDEVQGKVMRLAKLTKRLDPELKLNARGKGWNQDLVDAVKRASSRKAKSTEIFFGKILRVGGKKRASILFETSRELAPISLQIDSSMASKAGSRIYRPGVSIEAEVVRMIDLPDTPICAGRVVVLDMYQQYDDPVAAWDAWYAAAGRPLKHLLDS